MSIRQKKRKRRIDWSIPMIGLTKEPEDGTYQIVDVRYVQLPLLSEKASNADYVLLWLEDVQTADTELWALLYGKAGLSDDIKAEIPSYNPFGHFILDLLGKSDFKYKSLPTTNNLKVLVGWEFTIRNGVITAGKQHQV